MPNDRALDRLLEILDGKWTAGKWAEESKAAFEALFGSDSGRYPAAA
jgi:hypothetical protein